MEARGALAPSTSVDLRAWTVPISQPTVDYDAACASGGSIDNTRAFARLSEERGGLAKVTEIASAGHDVWRIAFAHAPLWDWLFTHEATRP